VNDFVGVFLAGAVTMFATGLGAIPVWFLGRRADRLRPLLWGLAAGVMIFASILGLLVPAFDEGGAGGVIAGIAAGVLFLVLTRRALGLHEHHHHHDAASLASRRALLVFLVLFVHSLPEGLAIGTAWASETEGLGLFIVIALSIHNIPEGTVTAIPLYDTGASRSRQFWIATLTSLPQPIAAPLALLAVEEVDGLIAPSFGFAAGAMLALVVTDLLPEALRRRADRTAGLAGLVAGALAMFVLATVLDV
jgi:ZIP family zinc transporter